MSRIIIIGCGVIGSIIAYELSQIPELKITVLDRQTPAQAATGAALGILMGAISQKIKGKNWQLRETSIRRYETLVPELEAQTGIKIPFNRQGILKLCLEGEDINHWNQLIKTRQSQGFKLEIFEIEKIRNSCNYLDLTNIKYGIYSPQDRQVAPRVLTLALVDAATKNGVNFLFNAAVEEIENNRPYLQVKTTIGTLECDWLIIAAGLGSSPLTACLKQLVDIRPVLGQALHLRLENPWENFDFQPVITSDDLHIVPCQNSSPAGEYWVGATVEFPTEGGEIVADSKQLNEVVEKAIAIFPALKTATIVRQWSGLRPRPEGRPAPIIGKLAGYDQVLLATGHYRNGILLAPATAKAIREAITGNSDVVSG